MKALPKILLVDDDPAIRSSLIFSLGLEGFDVQAFESAEAMVDALTARAIDADPGCLIIDYRLPGIDGLALLALLRERGVSAPTVIITSNPTRSLKSRTAEAGASLVEKPLLSDALSLAIRNLVAAAAPAAHDEPRP